MSFFRVKTPPAAEPISLADAKANMRVDHSDDDVKITRHIREAREFVERRIQKAVALQTYEMGLDAFPSAEAIELLISPVVSITSVKYYDTDDVLQTIDDADYYVNESILYPTGAWPTDARTDLNTVVIEFVAGYSDVNLAPSPVIAAMYLKIKGLYDGDNVDQAVHDLLTNYYTMVA